MSDEPRWSQPHSDVYTPADFRAPPGESSKFTYDALTTTICQRLAEKGLYGDIVGDLSAEDRAEVEAAAERYGAEMRARGKIGW